MRSRLPFKISLGGVIAAVCLFSMFCTGILPMLDYTIPTFAGFLMVIMIVDTDTKWAFTTYAAVSFLCLIITPNLEASMLFILFMGYYPILRVYLDRIPVRLVRVGIKFAVFNAALIIFYSLVQYVFMADEDMTEGMEMFGRYALMVLWLMANVFFVMYDRLLGQLTALYVNWFRKKILRRK